MPIQYLLEFPKFCNSIPTIDTVEIAKKNSGSKNFATGSIAWSGSLSFNNYNNNISKITSNVLNNFIK